MFYNYIVYVYCKWRFRNKYRYFYFYKVIFLFFFAKKKIIIIVFENLNIMDKYIVYNYTCMYNDLKIRYSSLYVICI